jgi:hypothetical protein
MESILQKNILLRVKRDRIIQRQPKGTALYREPLRYFQFELVNPLVDKQVKTWMTTNSISFS